MTSRGSYFAAWIAVAIAFLLPKQVDCSYPGQACGTAGPHHTICHYRDIEPLGFYVLELALDRNVGFAYSRELDCR